MSSIKQAAEEMLLQTIIPFWKGLRDEENGGFYGYMDFDLKLDKKAEKGCILNSRILWFFSEAAMLTGRADLAEDARHAYQFFLKNCYDEANGGVYWSCDYTGKRILLVEDNELNREIAKEIIGMTGVSIECAENGREAVEKFTAAPVGYYDLIFMDIQMPLMNGYETTAAIRAQTLHGGQTIPIVAMTANAFEEDRKKAFECGMNGYIVKPIDRKSISKVLDQIFKEAK